MYLFFKNHNHKDITESVEIGSKFDFYKNRANQSCPSRCLFRFTQIQSNYTSLHKVFNPFSSSQQCTSPCNCSTLPARPPVVRNENLGWAEESTKTVFFYLLHIKEVSVKDKQGNNAFPVGTIMLRILNLEHKLESMMKWQFWKVIESKKKDLQWRSILFDLSKDVGIAASERQFSSSRNVRSRGHFDTSSWMFEIWEHRVIINPPAFIVHCSPGSGWE